MEYPQCPHCKFSFRDEHLWHDFDGCTFPTEKDGDDSEFDCPSCGKTLFVTLETTPRWWFTDEDGNDI